MAFLLLLRSVVLHENFSTTRYSPFHQDQRTMRTYRQRGRLFLKGLPLCIVAAYPHRYLHQDSLASAARPRTGGNVRRLTHRTSSLDYTATPSFVEREPKQVARYRNPFLARA
jgi:hypothetical protein